MHQYGREGFCLIWAVNNALQQNIVKQDEVLEELAKKDEADKSRDWEDFIDNTGIDFNAFRDIIRNKYGIELRKVNGVSNIGGFIITVEYKDYLHSISLYNGKVLDNRKRKELKHIPWDRVYDIYQVIYS